MSAPDILAIARWLQSRHGLHVSVADHPGRAACCCRRPNCDERGKHPRGQWSRLATLSPVVIRGLLADGPWNILVACKLSGLLVIDEDRPGAFAAFASSIGQVIEPTFTVTTSKGCHFYYRQAKGAPLGNGRGRLAGLGIDVRGGGDGNGGYVVGPGSIHQTGTLYSPVDSSAPILPVPGWLAEALRPHPVPEQSRPGRPVSTYGALKGLVRVVLEAEEGERNNSLYWSSCRAAALVAGGKVSASTATSVLVDAAARIGLPEAEARRTIASGLRATEGVRHG